MKTSCLLLVLIAMLCTACEKDYTCLCTTPALSTTPFATYPLPDKTHRQAKKECAAYERQNVPGGGLTCSLR